VVAQAHISDHGYSRLDI